jgi:hypothetical protein
VPSDDARIACAKRAGCAHILLGGLDLGRRAGGAGEIGPLGETDHHHEQRHGVTAQALATQRCPKQGESDDRHHQGRERELNVGCPAYDAVQPAADTACEQTQRHADGGLDGDGEDANYDRDAGAAEDGAQEIAALRVGAEQETRIAPLHPTRR